MLPGLEYRSSFRLFTEYSTKHYSLLHSIPTSGNFYFTRSTTVQSNPLIMTQTWKCDQCGLPGVRLSTSQDSHSAYYKCIPCNRSLGQCPCTTPGSRTTSTCPCGENSRSGSPGLDVPRGVSMLSKEYLHNPDSGFDEDWESNCKPGFMVSRFKAAGHELLWA
ncbi:hypothetical protein N7513_010295 [Penicillium frequentans]|nr:hypothetical protein N7513_010295 [Penicillium glabrum]